MPSVPFMPFQNESDAFSINELNLENRLDRISIYGSLNITKDKEGLQYALLLKRLIDATVDELKRDRNLPDTLAINTSESVGNPFL